jgi:AraC-like DNA-binding protein
MGNPVVLLISADSNSSGTDAGWIAQTQAFCTIHRVRSTDELHGRIKLLCPHVLCFEFSGYDPAGLSVLLHTKQTYPSLPILMITEEHSEELAVWALRARVWDYLVKPVAIHELHAAIMALHGLATQTGARGRRRMVSPGSLKSARSASANNHTRVEAVVEKIRAYIARHLSEKISEAELADRCAMSYFHFSRTFRRVVGVTLREYILRERINKAAKLLQSSSRMSVMTACIEAGFHDPSYFARMFRRYKGVSPSTYRQAAQAGINPAPARVLHVDRPA